MIVTLGYTKNDKNKLIKDFTIIKEFNVKWKEETSLISPTLILSNATYSEVSSFNYCYIADFKRYYFINNITLNTDGTFTLECSVDVLNSFKSDILMINGTVKRAENSSNGYILDNEYKALAYSNIVTKRFPNAMTNDSFILMTVG